MSVWQWEEAFSCACGTVCPNSLEEVQLNRKLTQNFEFWYISREILILLCELSPFWSWQLLTNLHCGSSFRIWWWRYVSVCVTVLSLTGGFVLGSTGSKVADPCCYGHTQFHLLPDRLKRERFIRDRLEDQIEVVYRSNGIASLFAWTAAQAMYQGETAWQIFPCCEWVL